MTTVTMNDKWFHKMHRVNMAWWMQDLMHEGAFDVASLVTLYFAIEYPWSLSHQRMPLFPSLSMVVILRDDFDVTQSNEDNGLSHFLNKIRYNIENMCIKFRVSLGDGMLIWRKIRNLKIIVLSPNQRYIYAQ